MKLFFFVFRIGGQRHFIIIVAKNSIHKKKPYIQVVRQDEKERGTEKNFCPKIGCKFLVSFLELEIITASVRFSSQTELFILPAFPIGQMSSCFGGIAVQQCGMACSVQLFFFFFLVQNEEYLQCCAAQTKLTASALEDLILQTLTRE